MNMHTPTPLQQSILRLADGTMSRAEIAAAVGATPQTVTEVMIRLRALGYAGDFRRRGRDNATPSDDAVREWLLAFWFRGARKYKPMLSHELERRGVGMASLAYLVRQRMVMSEKLQDGKTLCYFITSLGREFVGDLG